METLLIAQHVTSQDLTHDRSPISLPCIRSIKLCAGEVSSWLIINLLFPPNVAVGFRMHCRSDWWTGNPFGDIATIRHVLGMVDIHCVTLAVGSPGLIRDGGLFVRLEWLRGSLEIAYPLETDTAVRDILFGPSGALFSRRPPYIEKARELHIVGCFFEGNLELNYIHAAMPNLVSISFFHYTGPRVFGLLTPTNPLSPPFPHL